MKSDFFSQVYEGHKALVMSICNLYSQGEEQNDLFQEIWAEIFKSIDGFKGNSKLSTWIFSVSRNTAISFSKKRPKKSANSARSAPPARNSETPEGIVLSREAMRDQILGLSPDEQEILLNKYILNQSYSELATKLNIPVSTVKSRLFEARKKLRNRIFRITEG